MFNFPWTNFHELNLDWILSVVKEAKEIFDNGRSDIDYAVDTADEAKEIATQAAEATIPDNSVSTQKIQDYAVTADKISNYSVTTAKLQNGCVTNPILADNAVTAAKIATNAVTLGKLSGDLQNIINGISGLFSVSAVTAGAKVTINSGGFCAFGSVVVLCVKMTTTAEVILHDVLFSGIPASAQNIGINISNGYNPNAYSCRTGGDNVYSNVTIPSGTELNIAIAYIKV